VDSTSKTLPVPEAPGGQLPVTRLYDMRQVRVPEGKVVDIYNLNYYWFIGYSDITASHFEREYIDIKDRLLHGYNQRWAYVTVAANVDERNQGRTDEIIEDLIARVYPQIVTKTGAGTAEE
jgi:hypothetical protein